MLLTLLLWIYSTIITFLAGDFLIRIGRRLVGRLPVLSTPLVCLIGAAALTAVLGWTWLLLPINQITHNIVAGLLAIYALWKRPLPALALPHWHKPWLGWLTTGVLFAVVWLRSVQLPRLADTGGYHAPMIEWIHQYSIVPGLANLNYRFGFNNSWFLLSALFRFQLTPDIPWHGLNGWILVMVGWFSLSEWHRQQQTDRRMFSAWLGGWLVLGFLIIFHWTLSSPSPDLPTHVYVVLCFWVWLRRAESEQRVQLAGWDWLLLVFSLSALTTKLSAVTVLVLPVLVILPVLRAGEWRKLLWIGTTIVVFTGYWWVSNVVLSGYVAYPSLSPFVDWFSVDWKVPRAIIAVGLTNLQQGTRGDLGTTFSLAWVPYWFHTRPVLEQGIFIALLIAPVLVFWRRRQVFAAIPGYGIALLTAWFGVVFWFLLAPEIRFGAGNVLVTLSLCYGAVLLPSAAGNDRMEQLSLAIACLVGLIFVVAALRREPIDLIRPAGYPDSPLRVYTVGTKRVVYPTDDPRIINGIRGYWGDCFDAGLPCSPYLMPDLRWRGQTLSAGFRTQSSAGH